MSNSDERKAVESDVAQRLNKLQSLKDKPETLPKWYTAIYCLAYQLMVVGSVEKALDMMASVPRDFIEKELPNLMASNPDLMLVLTDLSGLVVEAGIVQLDAHNWRVTQAPAQA